MGQSTKPSNSPAEQALIELSRDGKRRWVEQWRENSDVARSTLMIHVATAGLSSDPTMRILSALALVALGDIITESRGGLTDDAKDAE